MLIIKLNELGSNEFSVLTESNVGKPLVIIINNILYYAPVVIEKITNGQFEISGLNSAEELNKLNRLIEEIKLRRTKSKID